jgi:hypothetical protein
MPRDVSLIVLKVSKMQPVFNVYIVQLIDSELWQERLLLCFVLFHLYLGIEPRALSISTHYPQPKDFHFEDL